MKAQKFFKPIINLMNKMKIKITNKKNINDLKVLVDSNC
uniref:Uncharacterized protein n=1 Tax=Vertebrata thuyoides TaxID=2006970 RepID=A0A1Z1MB94_9FLOR|nr:hypothetical protein [Vertebrata thuyoides]ARW63193.1 hypothetical protein [Vertebrata thuyoides]